LRRICGVTDFWWRGSDPLFSLELDEYSDIWNNGTTLMGGLESVKRTPSPFSSPPAIHNRLNRGRLHF
jgi:hypothetical protein